jgi:two-component system chemotaxis response regulator CheB
MPPTTTDATTGTERVEVIALVASAGGLEALSAVLRSLPEEFPAAVVVAQHLAGHGSRLTEILERRIKLARGVGARGRAGAVGLRDRVHPRGGDRVIVLLEPSATTFS